MAKTPAEKRADTRARQKALGFVERTIVIHKSQLEAYEKFKKSLLTYAEAKEKYNENSRQKDRNPTGLSQW